MAHAFIVRRTEPKTLTGISITSLPTKTTYTEGDVLDLSGMVVTATYSSGEIATITGYTTYPENGATLSTIGSVTVNVSYTENSITETTSFAVSVAEAKPYARELEYIESDGTQYIDTGFKPNQDTRICMDVTPNAVGTNTVGGFFFGSGYPVQQNGIEGYVFGSIFYGVYNGNQTNGNVTVNAGERLKIDFNKNSYNAKRNNVPVYNSTFPYAAFTSPVNLHLLVLPRQGRYYGSCKLYSCQIYNNSSLIRDYIPVLDYSGVACLYDKINKKLYHNQGTGTFKYAQ